MATSTPKRIVCVTTEYPHRHIVRVGIGTSPTAPTESLTVAAVRRAIDDHVVFYTVSPSTNKVALVRKFTCECGFKTIRSAADAIADNNLDTLTSCR